SPVGLSLALLSRREFVSTTKSSDPVILGLPSDLSLAVGKRVEKGPPPAQRQLAQDARPPVTIGPLMSPVFRALPAGVPVCTASWAAILSSRSKSWRGSGSRIVGQRSEEHTSELQ